MHFQDLWQARLDERAAQHLLREPMLLQSAQASQITIDQQHLINFSSNDYLNLANHPYLKEIAAQAMTQYGVGAGASHTICGHQTPHHQLEEALATFTGRESAVLFSTGYMANLGVMSALLGKHDAVFHDRLNHASLLDGGLLSGARFQRYLHCDLNNLQMRLNKTSAQQKMIVTDGVFSMDGDIAPLPDLAKLAKQQQACVMVDDAHGFGVLGHTGAGSLEHFNLSSTDVPIYMGTLGKALGSFGAFVAGSKQLVQMLKQFARSYIYTTAMPPAVAATSLASLQLLADEAWRRQKLHENIGLFVDMFSQRFAAELSNSPLVEQIQLLPSQTAVQAVIVGGNENVLQLKHYLFAQGFLVGAIRSPTVAKGSERLRITLNAEHSEQQIENLVDCLIQALSELDELSA